MVSKFSYTYLILLILIICGTYIRVANLSQYPFSPDDFLHIHISSQTITQLFQINNQDTNAPLLYLILHFLYQLGMPDSYSRLVSLIPGILLIPAVFYLGKIYFNRYSGLFLAFMVAFGETTVLLSQSVRQYSLYFLFSALLFIVFKKLVTIPSKKQYIYYSVFALLTILLQHSAILILGLLYFSRIRFYLRKDFKIWSLVQLPSIAAFLLSFYFQGRKSWFSSSIHHQLAVNYWLSSGFPTSVQQILINFFRLFGYFSVQMGLIALVLMVFFIIGNLLLIIQRKYILPFVTLWAFIINILLSLLKIYPFTDSRQTTHFLIPVLLVASAPFTILSHFPFRKYTFIPLVFFILTITLCISGLKYYRVGLPASNPEFPLTKSVMDQYFSRLSEIIQPDDLIITDNQTPKYFTDNNISYPHMYFFKNDTFYISSDSMKHILAANTEFSSHRLIFTQLGWIDPQYHRWLSDPQLLKMVSFSDQQYPTGGGYAIFVINPTPYVQTSL